MTTSLGWKVSFHCKWWILGHWLPLFYKEWQGVKRDFFGKAPSRFFSLEVVLNTWYHHRLCLLQMMNLIYPAISTILDILRITFMHPFDEKRLCATRFLSQPRVLIRYWMECQQMRWKGSDAIQLSCQLSTNIPCTTNFYSAWRTVLIIALVNEAHDTMSSVTSSSRLIVVLMDGGAKGLVLLLAFAYRHCTKLYRCSGDHERTFPIEGNDWSRRQGYG